jgi:hypothetical protein
MGADVGDGAGDGGAGTGAEDAGVVGVKPGTPR